MNLINSRDVNPEGIKGGDIISTPHGIARVGWVLEDRGFLAYSPLSDINDRTYSKEIPIRSASLLSRGNSIGQGEQLSLPFITEMVESAIMDRNRRLEEMRSETFAPKNSEPKKKKDSISTKDDEDKKLIRALSKLSKEELEKLLA